MAGLLLFKVAFLKRLRYCTTGNMRITCLPDQVLVVVLPWTRLLLLFAGSNLMIHPTSEWSTSSLLYPPLLRTSPLNRNSCFT